MRRLAVLWCALGVAGTVLAQPSPVGQLQPVAMAGQVLAAPQIPAGQYISLVFHDVRDDVRADLDHDPYAISTDHLVQFFDWMQRNDWHPVSLQQIIDVQAGKGQLPKNAVLLTFDDGAESSYSHVFPLLKSYGYPAMMALVTSWLNGKEAQDARSYGYSGFLKWHQIKEMQQSGLVEFASHSDHMHQGILANPQGNKEPALISRQYFPASASQPAHYENEAQFETRIRQDLQASLQTIQRKTGVRPRAVVWPYGAASQQVDDIARAVGFSHSFMLGGFKPARVQEQGMIDRMVITRNPTVAELVSQVQQILQPAPQFNHAVYINLDTLYSDNPIQFENNLSGIVEQVKRLKIRSVYVQAYADANHDGSAESMYFPNRHFPMRADIFNRVAWQLRSRAYVKVYAVMPLLSFQLPDAAQQQRLSITAREQHLAAYRLSPLLPEAQQIVGDVYVDLANRYPSLDGLLMGANAQIGSDEDIQACHPQARWPLGGQPVNDCRQISPQQHLRMVNALGTQVSQPVLQRINLSNGFKVARELNLTNRATNAGLAAGALMDIASQVPDTPMLQDMARQFDELVLSVPLWAKRDNPALRQIIHKVKSLPHYQRSIVFNLRGQQLDDQHNLEQFEDNMQQLTRAGIQNFAYTAPDFLLGDKNFALFYKAISLNNYPYFYRGALLSMPPVVNELPVDQPLVDDPLRQPDAGRQP